MTERDWNETYWPWYPSKDWVPLVKLPDDAPPDLCPPQVFSRAPHAEWALVGLRHNRCRWGPQAGSTDTEHLHVCAHPRRQCKATP